MRARARRRWVAGMLVPLLALGACTPQAADSPAPSAAAPTTPPDGLPAADEAAASVVAALNAHDLSAVKATRPSTEVAAEFEAIFALMGGHFPTATLGQVTYEGADTALAALTMTWRLGVHGWEYETVARFRHSGGTWRLEFSPTLIHPQLTSDSRLQHTQDNTTRAPINDLDGLALVEERPLYQVGIDKFNLPAEEWAAAARQLATALGIDVAAFEQKVADAGPQAFVIAATLEQAEIPAAVSEVPGRYIHEISAVLGPTSGFATPILGRVGEPTAEAIESSGGQLTTADRIGLSGLQSLYDEQLRGVPMVRVDAVGREEDATGEEAFQEINLFLQDASVGEPLTISLERNLQIKAEEVLADQPGLATLVVLDVASGAVLAAAQSPAGGEYPHTTGGGYQPGSTFKVVSALAMLRQGATPATLVDCPASLTVEGHTINNYSGYPASATGRVPLSTAFANSCNTAFAGAATTIPTEQLTAAAGSLGVGTDYLSGYRAFFGEISPETALDRATSMIGQGKVSMSPLGMASVAASVASGRTVLPWLVKGKEMTSTAAPLTEAEAAALQELMGGVVTSGTGTMLRGMMSGAKSGTAEFGTAGSFSTHAWMIAYNDTYAVSAFVEQGDSGGSTAAPLIVKLFS